MKMSLNEATEAAVNGNASPLCDRCGDGHLQEQPIQTAFWRAGGLVVIRNIPAMVCSVCGEEYVADRTAIGLDRMRGAGLATAGPIEPMIVPVVDYVDSGSVE